MKAKTAEFHLEFYILETFIYLVTLFRGFKNWELSEDQQTKIDFEFENVWKMSIKYTIRNWIYIFSKKVIPISSLFTNKK